MEFKISSSQLSSTHDILFMLFFLPQNKSFSFDVVTNSHNAQNLLQRKIKGFSLIKKIPPVLKGLPFMFSTSTSNQNCVSATSQTISSVNNTHKNCKSSEISSMSVNAFPPGQCHRDGEMDMRGGWGIWGCRSVTESFILFLSFL